MERTRADVRVAAPVTAEVMAHALREAVKFLLFVRQQMPSSYDELRAALVDSVGAEGLGLPSQPEANSVSPDLNVGGKRKRVTSRERAATKLFKEVEKLLGCLTPELLRSSRPTEVALFLGSTPNRPKEIFVFSLVRVQKNGYQPWIQSLDAEKRLGNSGRRLVRECLPAVASAPIGVTTKAFLMMKAGVCLNGGTANDGTNDGTDPPPPGFLPKRGFEPNVKHTKVWCDFCIAPKDDDARDSATSPDAGDERERIWYQCTAAVKGLKTLKGVGNGL